MHHTNDVSRRYDDGYYYHIIKLQCRVPTTIAILPENHRANFTNLLVHVRVVAVA